MAEVERMPAGRLLGEVTTRLRCRDGGKKPVELILTDDPASGTSGRQSAPGVQRVRL